MSIKRHKLIKLTDRQWVSQRLECLWTVSWTPHVETCRSDLASAIKQQQRSGTRPNGSLSSL